MRSRVRMMDVSWCFSLRGCLRQDIHSVTGNHGKAGGFGRSVAILTRSKQTVYNERAILVGVIVPGKTWDASNPLEELYGLAVTAGAEVVGTVVQKRQQPDPSTYIGKGKVEELARLVTEKKADLVIFDNDLSPAQGRNLERAVKARVIDRTELILDIFATRARTHEARLQVELAQLEYALPRLRRMWTHLGRIKGGIGMRGPGEQQLEEDRRVVSRRITDLKRELQEVERRRAQTVAARREEITVSLVGYTNAGKSTLMNALTNAGVFVEDALFATLDTRTRRWHIPGWGYVLLSDTVGFIRDLPHHLVASFRATLEEVREADLLLHVIDASNPYALQQAEAVHRVLKEMDCDHKPMIHVLNKIDRVPDRSYIELLRANLKNTVTISAKDGTGLDELARRVLETLKEQFALVEVSYDPGNGKLISYLRAHSIPASVEQVNGRALFRGHVPPAAIGRIRQMNGDVRVLEEQRAGTGVGVLKDEFPTA